MAMCASAAATRRQFALATAQMVQLLTANWSILDIQKPKGCDTLVCYDAGDFIELDVLRVRPGARTRGVGSEAVRRVQRLGRMIHVVPKSESNRPADLVRFYKRLGFVAHEDGSMFWIPKDLEG